MCAPRMVNVALSGVLQFLRAANSKLEGHWQHTGACLRLGQHKHTIILLVSGWLQAASLA